MANSLWDLFVRISGDNSGLKQSLKGSQDDLGSFEQFAAGIGEKLAASLGFAAIGAAVIKTGVMFDSASAKIGRATGMVGADLAGLNKSFADLYSESTQSGEQVAAGLAKIAIETKMTGTALEKLTQVNLNFAKVTSSDVGGAIEGTQ